MSACICLCFCVSVCPYPNAISPSIFTLSVRPVVAHPDLFIRLPFKSSKKSSDESQMIIETPSPPSPVPLPSVSRPLPSPSYCFCSFWSSLICAFSARSPATPNSYSSLPLLFPSPPSHPHPLTFYSPPTSPPSSLLSAYSASSDLYSISVPPAAALSLSIIILLLSVYVSLPPFSS